jgi:hypothetical protein
MAHLFVTALSYRNRVCPEMSLADRTGFQIASTMSALYELIPLESRSRTKPDSVEYTDTLLRSVAHITYYAIVT